MTSIDSPDGREWVNLTSHDVRVVDDAGEEILFAPADGRVARLAELETARSVDGVTGIPIRWLAYAEVVDLPHPTGAGLLIVSRVTALAVDGRTGRFFPDREVRDKSGMIVGCWGAGPVHRSQLGSRGDLRSGLGAQGRQGVVLGLHGCPTGVQRQFPRVHAGLAAKRARGSTSSDPRNRLVCSVPPRSACSCGSRVVGS